MALSAVQAQVASAASIALGLNPITTVPQISSVGVRIDRSSSASRAIAT
jgi:hypothetical protein